MKPLINNMKRKKNSEFVQSLARIAVAQVCESLGLQGFQLSALDTLSDIACRYIQDLGKLSTFYANLASRTQSNVFDIIHGLEDLDGFVGGSVFHRCCLSESLIVKEISRFVSESEQVGFAYSVPHFPVVKERSFFRRAVEARVVDNVPSCLPCFPDPNTYPSLASAIVEESETKNDEMLSLLKSEPRLVCSGFEVPFVVKAGRNSGKEQVDNPFLVSALEYGEMKVSLVSLPARFVEEDVARNCSLWAKHVSSLWTFAPVIQGFKNCDVDTYEGRKEIALGNRALVKLKFNTRKNSLATVTKRRKTETAEFKSWFAVDDSGNDVKMTKEKIEEDAFGNRKQTC